MGLISHAGRARLHTLHQAARHVAQSPDRDEGEYVMPDVATFRRTAMVSNGRGGTTPGPVTTWSTRCALTAASGTEAAGDLVAARGAYRLRLPVDADVAVGDSVAIGGTRFRVVFAPVAGASEVVRVAGLTEVL